MNPTTTPTEPPTRPRAWVGFFVALGLLTAAGAALPILFNLGQQLKPDDLRRAADLWREAGPADYDLNFRVRHDREEQYERHIVLVRGGRPALAIAEDEIVFAAPALGAALGAAAFGAPPQRPRDVPTLLAHLDALLRRREQGGARTFLVAAFDPRQGYPRRIAYRVRSTGEREEYDLQLWPAGALAERSGGGKR